MKLSSSFGLGPGTLDPSVQLPPEPVFPTLQEICEGLRRKKDARPGQAVLDERPLAEPFTG